MAEYTFRLAAKEDREAIVRFMRAHWEAPHPLIERQEWFAYYYQNQDGTLRFALCEQQGRLCALAGYIPASQAPQPDVWVSLWVADKTAQGSGLELMAAMPALIGCRTLACNNIRPNTRPFYEFLGYATGRMGHFYRLAPKETYVLAQVAQKQMPPVGGQAVLQLLENTDDLRKSGFVPPQANPYKDSWYIQRRFFAYPGQSYLVFAASLPGDNAPRALLCLRLIEAAGTRVLRVADYIGPADFLPEMGGAIDGLLCGHEAEYVDFYCAGIPTDILYKTGFVQRAEDSHDVVPNYLQPPLWQNTEYHYFTNRPQGFVMCKADGDQDRPNIHIE